MVYNSDIHHRRSIRLKGYDYSLPNYYFVTICVNNRECSFGEIRNGKMILTEIGKTTEQCWRKISEQFPGINIDTFCIMPNHLHGIIDTTSVGAQFIAPVNNSLNNPEINKLSNRMGVINHAPTLGEIVRYFKGKASFIIRKKHKYFQWQRNYYDHIIRNDQSMENITNYIINNPFNWRQDIENALYFKNPKEDDINNYYEYISKIK